MFAVRTGSVELKVFERSFYFVELISRRADLGSSWLRVWFFGLVTILAECARMLVELGLFGDEGYWLLCG